MKSYTERVLAPASVLAVLHRVRLIVDAVPGLTLPDTSNDLAPEVSCHMMARAVAALFPELECVDGAFAQRGYEHSWLRFRELPWILDVYPVAQIGGPFLVDGSWYSPWSKLYIPSELDITTRPGWAQHLDIVMRAVRATAEGLAIHG